MLISLWEFFGLEQRADGSLRESNLRADPVCAGFRRCIWVRAELKRGQTTQINRASRHVHSRHCRRCARLQGFFSSHQLRLSCGNLLQCSTRPHVTMSSVEAAASLFGPEDTADPFGTIGGGDDAVSQSAAQSSYADPGSSVADLFGEETVSGQNYDAGFTSVSNGQGEYASWNGTTESANAYAYQHDYGQGATANEPSYGGYSQAQAGGDGQWSSTLYNGASRSELCVSCLKRLHTQVASSRTEITHTTNTQHPKPMLCNNPTTLHPLRTPSTLSRRHTHLILMLVRLPCRTQMELRGLSPTPPPSLHMTLTTWRALGQAIRPRQRPSPPQPLITHTRRRTMRHHQLNTVLPSQAPRMHTQRRRIPNTQLAL